MNTTTKSLVWAGAIIAAAIVARLSGMGDAAGFALITSIVAAAIAANSGSGRSCSKGCR